MTAAMQTEHLEILLQQYPTSGLRKINFPLAYAVAGVVLILLKHAVTQEDLQIFVSFGRFREKKEHYLRLLVGRTRLRQFSYGCLISPPL